VAGASAVAIFRGYARRPRSSNAMIPRLLLTCLCLSPLAQSQEVEEPPAPPVNTATLPEARDGRALERHQRINARVAGMKGACDLVFVGDSITEGFEDEGKKVWSEHYATRRAANLGISGDRTEHVLWRLENGNLDGLQPKLAVVMIGTNNFGHRTHEAPQVLEGVQAVVKSLRAKRPDMKILLLGIFPRGDRFNAMRGDILQVNQALSRMSDGDVSFLDIGASFVEDDGSISKEVMPDALHLSPEGYRRWAEAMNPMIEQMLGS
jgi:beta-glucosidase